MRDSVTTNIERVEARYGATEFKKYLDSFNLDCRVRNLTEKTIDVYYERLGYFIGYLTDQGIGLNKINKTVVQEYILSLKDNVATETINGRLRAIKRFFNHLEEEELWTDRNPTKGIKLLKTEKRVKPIVTPKELQKIIASLNGKTYEANRNRVMILLFWDGMLRLNELLNIQMADIDVDARLVKIFGKGRKERMVPLGLKTIRAVHQFLLKWRSKYPGNHLICMRNGLRLSERHCHKILQGVGQKVGVKLYPHLLRHSAATWYIRQGGNPAVLQKILGHTSLLVTQNYLHLSNEDTVSSYNSFSPSNCLKI